jgi:nucleotide-binding universal stress UspA family protein
MSEHHDPTPHRIVVGVDGSPSSQEALAWAIRQAKAVGATVDACTAWEYPQFYGSMGWSFPDGTAADLTDAAERVLHDALARAGAPETEVDVPTCVVYGTPAQVLLDAAKGAELLVVGSRGHGGFTGALLGSVGQHCVQHAPCPVVVVRHGT